jgi:hypothetical protein
MKRVVGRSVLILLMFGLALAPTISGASMRAVSETHAQMRCDKAAKGHAKITNATIKACQAAPFGLGRAARRGRTWSP